MCRGSHVDTSDAADMRVGVRDSGCAPLTPRANVVTEYRGVKIHEGVCGSPALYKELR